jgi:hypothetical protein
MKLTDFKIGDVIVCGEYSYRPLKIIAIEKSAQGVEYILHNDVNGMSIFNEMNSGIYWELYKEPTPEKKLEKRVMYQAIDHQNNQSSFLFKTIQEAEMFRNYIGYTEVECMIEVKE